jgi:hypothetical protein
MTHEYTPEEVRERFIESVRSIVDYWEHVPNPYGTRESGVAFSILSMLDGCNGGLPGFVVAPAPHPDDKQYYIDHGENYYPEAPEVKCDIAGGLHEHFAKEKP